MIFLNFSIDKLLTTSTQIEKIVSEFISNEIKLTMTKVIVNFQSNSIWRKYKLEIPAKNKIQEKWDKITHKLRNPIKIPKSYEIKISSLIEQHDIILDNPKIIEAQDGKYNILNINELYSYGITEFILILETHAENLSSQDYFEVSASKNPIINGNSKTDIYPILLTQKTAIPDSSSVELIQIPIRIPFPFQVLASSFIPSETLSLIRKAKKLFEESLQQEEKPELIYAIKTIKKETGYSLMDLNHLIKNVIGITHELILSKITQYFQVISEDEFNTPLIKTIQDNTVYSNTELLDMNVNLNLLIYIPYITQENPRYYMKLIFNRLDFLEDAKKVLKRKLPAKKTYSKEQLSNPNLDLISKKNSRI